MGVCVDAVGRGRVGSRNQIKLFSTQGHYPCHNRYSIFPKRNMIGRRKMSLMRRFHTKQILNTVTCVFLFSLRVFASDFLRETKLVMPWKVQSEIGPEGRRRRGGHERARRREVTGK